MTCAVNTCDRPVEHRDWCGMHYSRWLRHGDPNKRLRRANGEGYIDYKGYRQYFLDGKHRFEHHLVWEKANGPIPVGYVIHHKDENKINNTLNNLELMTSRKHLRHHARLRADARGSTDTHKHCPQCGVVLPRSDFNKHRQSWDGLAWCCRSCVAATRRKVI